jgi:hypothetical protein
MVERLVAINPHFVSMRRAIASAIGRLEAVGNDWINNSPAGATWTNV